MDVNPKLLIIDFPWAGPWGADMGAALRDLAADIAAEPGLLWKLWTEDPVAGRAGGVYLFRDTASREAYFAKHSARLAGFGITALAVQRFDVNAPLSAATRAAL